MKKNRIFALICAACGAILIFASCNRAGAGVSALAVSNTVSLTAAQTVALFGNSLQCEYMSTDGTYHSITLTYDGYVNHANSDHFYDPSGSTIAGRDFVNYSVGRPADFDVSASSMSVLFKTAVDISSLTYFDSALLTYSTMDINTQLYGTYVNYWYCSDGYHYAARQGAPNTNQYNLYGYIVDTYSQTDIVTPCIYISSNNTTFKTGWANIGTFGSSGKIQIGIVCPILSADWVYSGSSGAGAGSESSGGGSDSDVSVDLSGVTSRLDSILEKLDEIIANQESNSSSSGAGDEPSALDSPPPSFDAAAAWSAADGAFQNPFSDSSGGGYDLGLSLPDSGSGGGSASPPVDPTPPDESDMGSGLAAVWFLISYIFGTFPWLATLTTFSLSVGVAVFIIFHGRGSE